MCTAFPADRTGCGARHLALAGGDLRCHAAGTSGAAVLHIKHVPGEARVQLALLLTQKAHTRSSHRLIHPHMQLLGVSILTFRGRAIADVVVEAVSPMLRSSSSAEQLPGFPEPSLATIWLPILMLYMPVSANGSGCRTLTPQPSHPDRLWLELHSGKHKSRLRMSKPEWCTDHVCCMLQVHSLTTAVVISYMLLPAPFVTAAWLGGLAIYYGTTTFNKPEHTGEHCLS